MFPIYFLSQKMFLGLSLTSYVSRTLTHPSSDNLNHIEIFKSLLEGFVKVKPTHFIVHLFTDLELNACKVTMSLLQDLLRLPLRLLKQHARVKFFSKVVYLLHIDSFFVAFFWPVLALNKIWKLSLSGLDGIQSSCCLFFAIGAKRISLYSHIITAE